MSMSGTCGYRVRIVLISEHDGHDVLRESFGVQRGIGHDQYTVSTLCVIICIQIGDNIDFVDRSADIYNIAFFDAVIRSIQCLNNIKYKFRIESLKNNKIAFEELIEKSDCFNSMV